MQSVRAVRKRRPDPVTVRLSVTLPQLDHRRLQQMAVSKRLSLGWLIRDAVRAYLNSGVRLP
jgi:predicted transcriptional regulator